jgi:hypothetical protein
MKSLFLNTQLLIYGPLFFLLVNVSDGKAPVSDTKASFSAVKPAVAITPNQDCMAALRSMNSALRNDQDGILNADEVEQYEDCLHSVQPGLDFKNNMYDYYFLLDCYTNLMDYYDMVHHDQDKLDEIEDSIEEISVDD